MGGTPPFTPQIIIPGWTAGGVHPLWVSEHPPRKKELLKLNWRKTKLLTKVKKRLTNEAIVSRRNVY